MTFIGQLLALIVSALVLIIAIYFVCAVPRRLKGIEAHLADIARQLEHRQ